MFDVQIELGYRSDGFCGGRKTGEPGGKTLGAGREPTANWVTEVGGECIFTAPPMLPLWDTKRYTKQMHFTQSET